MNENRNVISSSSRNKLSDVIDSQQNQLDDTEYYATAWAEALRAESSYGTNKNFFIRWGGKGKGGRDLARKTYQPKDVIVEHVRLEYCSVSNSTMNKSQQSMELKSSTTNNSTNVAIKPVLPLLDDAYLKLLHGHIYALIGSSGCGKSSLLRRMNSLKIPGFPAHLSTLYIPQEMILLSDDNIDVDLNEENEFNNNDSQLTPQEYVIHQYNLYTKETRKSTKIELEMLECQIEKLDMSIDENLIKMEELAQLISELEDEDNNNDNESNDVNENNNIQLLVQEAFTFFDIPEIQWTKSLRNLSEGVLKKIALAVILVVIRKSKIDLLLLDEPTCALDILGLVKLRKLISFVMGNNNTSVTEDDEINSKTSTIILLVSHDIDFLNSVATDVIDFSNHKLYYYNGNYADYIQVREQNDTHNDKMIKTLDKKRDNMKLTISNLKKKKNTRRQIESHKKRFEREVNADFSNDQLNDSTESRRKFGDEPNKAIQFMFRKVLSQWNEPLIMAMNVGHGYDEMEKCNNTPENNFKHYKKNDGFLFDCVDLCIDEGGTYCILGENSCGKTTLLKLLAGILRPLEGKAVYAKEVEVAYIDQFLVDSFIIDNTVTISRNNNHNNNNDDIVKSRNLTALEYLTKKYPNKTNQDIRGELTNFGLSTPQQVSGTPLCYLSGGERRRFCLADCMLSNPHVIIFDEPTNSLDAESVDALIYGLTMWNGTIIMTSHDCNFVRSLDAKCFVLLAKEGKLCRVDGGGIDIYLKSFTTPKQYHYIDGGG